MVWTKKLYQSLKLHGNIVYKCFLGNGSIALMRFLAEFKQTHRLPILSIVLRSPALSSEWHGLFSYLFKECGTLTRCLDLEQVQINLDLGPPMTAERSDLWYSLSSPEAVAGVGASFLWISDMMYTQKLWDEIYKLDSNLKRKHPLLSFCSCSEGYYSTQKIYIFLKNETEWKRGKYMYIMPRKTLSLYIYVYIYTK